MSILKFILNALRSSVTKPWWPWIAATPFLIVLFEYLAVAAVGSSIFLWLETPFMIVALGAMIAVVVIPFILIACPSRRPSLTAWWLTSLCFLSIFLSGFILGKKIRTSAFHNLAVRSETLVAAIRQYTDHGGSPPESLEDLVPTYLSQVPGTGIMAYPKYRYEVGDAAQHYEGNPWVLRVSTPSGGINFDEFLFFPRRNYPSHGYGGTFERIGEWAYLHE